MNDGERLIKAKQKLEDHLSNEDSIYKGQDEFWRNELYKLEDDLFKAQLKFHNKRQAELDESIERITKEYYEKYSLRK